MHWPHCILKAIVPNIVVVRAGLGLTLDKQAAPTLVSIEFNNQETVTNPGPHPGTLTLHSPDASGTREKGGKNWGWGGADIESR